MTLLEIIKEAIEDITSIQIATLHGGNIPMNSVIDQDAKKKIEALIETQEKKVADAQNAWLDAEEKAERRKLKRKLLAEKRRLAELRMELFAISPRDIFSKIEVAMGQASAAGYSKYHLSSNSVNFINSDLGEEKSYLLEAHDMNVQTALQSRQDLINAAKDLIQLGMSL